jgi:GntR family transcriptional regulator, rspAB operon transcriptional repressor
MRPELIFQTGSVTGEPKDKAAGPAQLVRTGVYEQLRAEILCCSLKPGAQLQERQLAERFHVSKSPVRDALLRLAEQDLIEVLPRIGYRVKRISLSDVRDLYEMRQLLERECIARLIDSAPAEALVRLNAYRAGGAGSELAQWIDYNRAFHAFFADHCGNARLARTARDVIEQFDRLTYTSVTSDPTVVLGDFVAEHCALIDAIQARDKRQAVAISKEHIESSRRRVLQTLESMSVIA